MSRRVLVTGSRDWTDHDTILAALIEHMAPGDVLVHGGARGADQIAAGAWNDMRHPWDKWCYTECWPADWEKHGRLAGPFRNRQMVDSKPDLCLAFIRNNSRGATHCLAYARECGVPCVIYRRDDA